jgi:hypothetical protein
MITWIERYRQLQFICILHINIRKNRFDINPIILKVLIFFKYIIKGKSNQRFEEVKTSWGKYIALSYVKSCEWGH